MGGYFGALLIASAIVFLNQFFLAAAGFVQLRTLSVTWGEAIRAAASAPLNLALAQAAGVGVLFAIAYPHRQRQNGLLEALRVKPLTGAVVALCFAMGLALQLPLAELGNLAQVVWPVPFDQLALRYKLVNPATWWNGFSALFALVIVAPVTEELVFRGWLLPMLSERYGTTAALAWTSMLFGLIHIEPGAIVYATVGGLILGAIAIRTGSTLASIAVHAGINALPLLLPVTLTRIEGFNTLSDRVEHISVPLLVTSVAIAGALLFVLWRSTAKRTTDPK